MKQKLDCKYSKRVCPLPFLPYCYYPPPIHGAYSTARISFPSSLSCPTHYVKKHTRSNLLMINGLLPTYFPSLPKAPHGSPLTQQVLPSRKQPKPRRRYIQAQKPTSPFKTSYTMASTLKSALPSHLKPSSALGGDAEFARKHHGKTQSHMVSAPSFKFLETIRMHGMDFRVRSFHSTVCCMKSRSERLEITIIEMDPSKKILRGFYDFPRSG